MPAAIAQKLEERNCLAGITLNGWMNVQCDLARLDNASAFTLRLAGQTDFAKTTVRSLGTTTFMMSCIQSILNLFKRTARDWIS
jgi:hypothetical protein